MDSVPEATLQSAVDRVWRRTASAIERLNDLTSHDPDAFPIEDGSVLAVDDRESSPFKVSGVAHSCINAGVDHLHALTSLVDRAGRLHLAAPFSLARGGLENFATAAWVLASDDRAVQIERALSWHAQNVTDGDRAMGDIDQAGARPVAEQWRLLDEVADRCDVGRDFRKGYSSTEAVKAAEAAFPTLQFGVLRPWRICSGYAHGRPWAMHGASHQTVTDGDDPETITLQLNSSLMTVLYPTVAATDLVEAVVGRHQVLASSTE